ncbi:MAG: hypothetical protein K2X66_06300, partial [Cyanobacteria bacterium]|nr:hypothetical protein [Cyanobacteriota bacterium]
MIIHPRPGFQRPALKWGDSGFSSQKSRTEAQDSFCLGRSGLKNNDARALKFHSVTFAGDPVVKASVTPQPLLALHAAFQQQVIPWTASEIQAICQKAMADPEVKAIVQKHPDALLQGLTGLTQWGRMESLNTLGDLMVNESKKGHPTLLDELPLSQTSSMHYLWNKGNFQGVRWKKLGRAIAQEELCPQGVLLYSPPVLASLQKSLRFRNWVIENKVQIVIPQGWEDGVNPWNQNVSSSPTQLTKALKCLIKRAETIYQKKVSDVQNDQASSLSWNDSLEEALQYPETHALSEIHPKLAGLARFVKHNAMAKTSSGGGPLPVAASSVERIVSQLAPALISEQELKKMIQSL